MGSDQKFPAKQPKTGRLVAGPNPETLRLLMHERKIGTLAELARRAGLEPRYVQLIANRPRAPGRSFRVREPVMEGLARALETRVDSLQQPRERVRRPLSQVVHAFCREHPSLTYACVLNRSPSLRVVAEYTRGDVNQLIGGSTDQAKRTVKRWRAAALGVDDLLRDARNYCRENLHHDIFRVVLDFDAGGFFVSYVGLKYIVVGVAYLEHDVRQFKPHVSMELLEKEVQLNG